LATADGTNLADLDAIVEDLRALRGRPRLDGALAIGQLLFDRFFEGSIAVWQNHSRTKAYSLRRLAQRPSCPMSKSALHQAVAVHVASLSLAGVQTSGHIGFSHIVAVLAFEAVERELLLRLAAENRWSVRRLRNEVIHRAPHAKARRGRPRHGAVRHVADRLRDCVRALIDAAASLRGIDLPAGASTEIDLQLEEMARAREELTTIIGSRPAKQPLS
jgi:hypothetical protein